MILADNFTFIDLFAGIGGFHCAMKKYSKNSRCVMASEIDAHARAVYEENFNMEPRGDIREIATSELGYFDVICGGFPCQTFSKAGAQRGFADARGTLFQEIIRLASEGKETKDKPKILLLENVHNLVSHDGGNTWLVIRDAIRRAGYNVVDTPIVIGPKDLGIPQIRDRAVILAVRQDIYDGPIEISVPRRMRNTTEINSILERDLSDDELKRVKLSEHHRDVLLCWDDFYHGINRRTLGRPVWSDEFGQDYDLSSTTSTGETAIPKWKQDFIQWNRDLYSENKSFIDEWIARWNPRSWMTPTERKFEWQCGECLQSVWEGIVQFRTSGVRVKRPTEAPTLVALNHIPVIAKESRYLTVREAARLQSFPDSFVFNESAEHAYRQLGNAVNVDVMEYVFRRFIEFLEEKTRLA